MKTTTVTTTAITAEATYRVYHHQGRHCRVVWRTADREAAIEECRRLNQEQLDAEGQGSGHYWTTDATDAAE